LLENAFVTSLKSLPQSNAFASMASAIAASGGDSSVIDHILLDTASADVPSNSATTSNTNAQTAAASDLYGDDALRKSLKKKNQVIRNMSTPT
jgi:hypothetical protein